MTIKTPLRKANTIKTLFETCQAMNNNYLTESMPSCDFRPTQLETAMHYSVFNGGKRFRPSVLYATVYTLGVGYDRAHSSAAAIELIHAYSLVHDDLPSMDNDDLRRGKPTCHIAYGEANAILAGDALQTLAFEILASDSQCVPEASIRIELIKILTKACGTCGMAGGQALDLNCEDTLVNIDTLKLIHQLKTGCLIEAAIEMGAVLARASPTERTLLKHYAKHLGLAFQIQDDILDITGDTHAIGKRIGSDQAKKKSTYPLLLGIETAQQLAKDAISKCHQSLKKLDRTCNYLHELADFVVDRKT